MLIGSNVYSFGARLKKTLFASYICVHGVRVKYFYTTNSLPVA